MVEYTRGLFDLKDQALESTFATFYDDFVAQLASASDSNDRIHQEAVCSSHTEVTCFAFIFHMIGGRVFPDAGLFGK